MEKTIKNKTAKKLLELIFIMSVALALALISNFVFKKIGTDKVVNNETKSVPIPYKEKDSINKLVIINNFKNSSTDGQPNDSFTKNISVVGSIDHGYLYVKANVNGKPLGAYDKVYLKLQNDHTAEQIGGWLVTDKSLETEKSTQSTELLYELSNVQYEKIGQNGYETISGDWLKMLNQNQNNSKSVIGFNSTLRQGEIEKVEISYTCSTNSNCSILLGN